MPNETLSGKVLTLPRGAYSKIARRLRPKVSVQHVREVALGRRTSARVTRAIHNFRAAIDNAQERAA